MTGLGVAVLAAGASRRMGRPKLLLPWGGTTVIGHILSVWQRLSALQVALVLRQNTIEAELDRLCFPVQNRVLNSKPDLGMFSSIQAAAGWARWNAAVSHIAFVLGDQPEIGETTLSNLLSSVQGDSIYQPAHGGRPRHPVIFPKHLLAQLASADCGTLKEFLQNHGRNRVLIELPDEALDYDLDTPSDYGEAVTRVNEKSRIA